VTSTDQLSSILLSRTDSPLTQQTRLEKEIGSLRVSRGSLQAKIDSSRQSDAGESSSVKIGNLNQYLEASETVLSNATTYYGSMSGSILGDPGNVESVVGLDSGQLSTIEEWRSNRSAG
jgi:hypothetical protein